MRRETLGNVRCSDPNVGDDLSAVRIVDFARRHRGVAQRRQGPLWKSLHRRNRCTFEVCSGPIDQEIGRSRQQLSVT